MTLASRALYACTTTVSWQNTYETSLIVRPCPVKQAGFWVGVHFNCSQSCTLLPLQASDMRGTHLSKSPLQQLSLVAERPEDEAAALDSLHQLPTTLRQLSVRGRAETGQFSRPPTEQATMPPPSGRLQVTMLRQVEDHSILKPET
jgi:hypothetical protein